MNTTAEIIFKEQPSADGLIGVIILNRTSKLNCLTLNMLQSLAKQLTSWQDNPSIKAVIIKSASEKAFCAGGDVRAIYDMQGNIEHIMHFFTQEYSFNQQLFHFNKPYIALLDGITMGGGCGISLHGSHPIATDKLTLAMPETKIGLFPDVGMSYHLSRCANKLGWYFGLSARSLDAATAFSMGLVKAVVNSENLAALEQALLNTPLGKDAHAAVDIIIEQFAACTEVTETQTNYEQIAKLFTQGSIEDVFSAIAEDDNEWAHTLLSELKQRSPLSLKLTFEVFKRASHLEFDNVIQQDLNLIKHLMQQEEFFIGVKALLIDKHNAPRWQYADIAAVPYDMVKGSFSTD